MTKRPVVLVDGKNLLYRAHFAHKDLRTSKGVPTSVLFGFPEMILDIGKFSATADIVICWEGKIDKDGTEQKESNWRKTMADFYKGNRVPNPEMKIAYDQVPELLRFLRILGYCQISVPGLEADDLLGVVGRTLARQEDVASVILYSGDRDLYQVVGRGNVVLLYPSKKEGPKLMDAEDIEKETGVSPIDWPKFKALAGDTSDNIKAIPGCAAKTAMVYLKGGVDPSVADFRSLPAAVRKRYPFLEQHWAKIHLCYILCYIPKKPTYRYYPQESRDCLATTIELVSSPARRREYSQTRLDKKVKRFINFCDEYELAHFISERRRFFPNTLVK